MKIKIEKAIEESRPHLIDGAEDIELMDADDEDGMVRVKLKLRCGCGKIMNLWRFQESVFASCSSCHNMIKIKREEVSQYDV